MSKALGTYGLRGTRSSWARRPALSSPEWSSLASTASRMHDCDSDQESDFRLGDVQRFDGHSSGRRRYLRTPGAASQQDRSMRLSTRLRRPFRRVCGEDSRIFFCRWIGRTLIHSASASRSLLRYEGTVRGVGGLGSTLGAQRQCEAFLPRGTMPLASRSSARRAGAAVQTRLGRSPRVPLRDVRCGICRDAWCWRNSTRRPDGGPERIHRGTAIDRGRPHLTFPSRRLRCFLSNATSRVMQSGSATFARSPRRCAPFLSRDERSSSDARARRRGREIDAMLATARWICASALERRETRGIHRRRDFPAVDDAPPGEP